MEFVREKAPIVQQKKNVLDRARWEKAFDTLTLHTAVTAGLCTQAEVLGIQNH